MDKNTYIGQRVLISCYCKICKWANYANHLLGMKSEQGKELASLTKFKCSQTSAKTARCVCHQRVNTTYNGRFHRPGRLWSLSHATGKTTRLILGLAFPEALSSINTVCAHTGRMSLIQHSFNKCLLCCLCPLRKPSYTL